MSHRPDHISGQYHAEFFLLRTPLLHAGTLDTLSCPPPTERVDMLSRISAARHLHVSELKRLIAQPVIQESIFLASRSLFEDTQRWLAGGEARPKLVNALMKYLQRMSSRPTPFGLFAGCSIGQVGNTTHIVLAPLTANRRYARIDSGCLDAIACVLAARPDIRHHATIFPNSSLYQTARGYRYVFTRHEHGRTIRSLVSLERNEFVDLLLRVCHDGEKMPRLATALMAADADAEIDAVEAIAFVNDLLDRQVLVSSVALTLTGQEPLDQLIGALDDCGDVAANARVTLTSLRAQIQWLNHQPLGIEPSSYDPIAQNISQLLDDTTNDNFIQVDLVRPTLSATLGSREVETLRLAIQAMHKLCTPSVDSELATFRDRFVSRYEHRDIPLLEVLDDDSGIGFGARPADHSPLLQDLPTIDPGQLPISFGLRDQALLRMLGRAHRDGARVIALTEDDVESLRSPVSLPLPKALYVWACLAHNEQGNDMDVLIRSISGPSGANMLGRFCHADPDVHRCVVRHLEQEEREEGALFAEVVHSPEGRLGNVVARPVFRRYEIPYLGASGAPQCRQLRVTDLMVRVRDDRVIILSATLQREIVPRLTTMHNYRLGPAVYRFLCAVQRQGVQGYLTWNWGVFEALEWLPRVQYRNIVLARAQWRLDAPLIRRLCAGSVEERYAEFYRWTLKNNAPSRLLLRDADHELPVHLNDALSVECFLSLVRHRTEAYVVEDWPDASRLLVHGVDGAFANEVVVPFVSDSAPSARYVTGPLNSADSHLSYRPGGEWLYVKYYVGRSAADDLLTRVLAPILRRFAKDGIVQEWFFLRYADPDWHIRLRLRSSSPTDLWREALPVVTGARSGDFPDGMAWKIQCDTYEPEFERYGGREAISLSEQMFHIDSQTVLRVLMQLQDAGKLDDRWLVCVCSWDLLLKGFGFSLEERLGFVTDGRIDAERQLNLRRIESRALSDRFRKERRSVEDILRGSSAGVLGACVKTLNDRGAMLHPVIRQVKELAATGRLSNGLRSLAYSHLHMNANRLLRSRHLEHELLMYDFLGRFYKSERAMAGHRTGSVS